MFGYLKEFFRFYRVNDPAVRSMLEIILTYPGVHAIFWYRIAHRLYKAKLFLLARLISQSARFFTGIEIHPGATIGKCLFIDHGMGIVVGETATIGDNVKMFHGVTLGGTGKEKGKRHPDIGNNVTLSHHCSVLGPVYVGENTKIGARALVLNDLPANVTAVGLPAKIVRWHNQEHADSL